MEWQVIKFDLDLLPLQFALVHFALNSQFSFRRCLYPLQHPVNPLQNLIGKMMFQSICLSS